MGLGLSISSKLMDLIGGQLWAESEQGKGSTFHFTLRCGLQAHAATRAPSLELDGLRVLVVVANSTSRMMSWRGRQLLPVVAASPTDGVAALQGAEEAGFPIQIRVLDASAGNDDEVERDKHAIRAGKSRPAVILISSAPRDDVARWSGLDLTATIPRPPKQSELLEALQLARGLKSGTVMNSQQGAPEPPAVIRSLRVLLAENNRINQRVATVMLEKHGHRVTIAGNGSEALVALAGNEFDLVLMDVHMPIMDGLRAAATIREREVGMGRHVPILALTANAMQGDRERCLAVGMDGYVAKPLRPDELWDAIRAVVPSRDG